MHRFPCDPPEIARGLLDQDRRVLLFGAPGRGKSTLARALAGELHAAGRRVCYLSADRGLPALGVPGAVSLGEMTDQGLRARELAALCSLDAARFRLPLALAAGRLVAPVPPATLLVDPPGVVRGLAAAELLDALLALTAIDLLLVLVYEDEPVALAQELAACRSEVVAITPSGQARRPSKRARARERTRLWDEHLADAAPVRLERAGLELLGTPPRDAPEAWVGKQVALLAGQRTLAMGEVTGFDAGGLQVALPPGARLSRTLLVRDAHRGKDGLLGTTKGFAADLVRYVPPPDVLPDDRVAAVGPRPVVRLKTATASLVNGVFGDPLLHLRLQGDRRSLLFDLGEGARLPVRIAHQVGDVFVTHAHVDHIGGFLWLLRSRIGESAPCRVFGPPGLAGHLKGFIDGIRWDRIADKGPRFEVAEVRGETLMTFGLEAGRPEIATLRVAPLRDWVLFEAPGFRVRYRVLDHGIPVLALSYEAGPELHLDPVRREALGLPPGPWLTRLKQCLARGERDAEIRLPDGRAQSAGELAEGLIEVVPGIKLVYATDFADTAENRARVIDLAQGAQVLFCEATFLERDRAQAGRTGHLTTSACAEIANAAVVDHLVPFHFSRRYEDSPWEVYQEIAAICPRTVLPKDGSRIGDGTDDGR